ncbi:MAG TPA: hypothetical protein VF756_14245 [Thermoanaerobaculia bacterium]
MSSPRAFATLLLLGLCLAGAALAQGFEPLGPPFQVSGSADDARWPSIAADISGNFVVVWYQPPEIAGQPSEILGRRYSATGDPLGDEFLIAEMDVFEAPQRPRIAMQPDGRFVVTWGDVFRVRARAFAADGRPLGEAAGAPDPDLFCCGGIVGTDVAALSDGRFVVAWTVEPDTIIGPPFREVQAQRLDGNGQLLGEVIEIASAADTAPGLAADRSGGFLVTWGSNFDVLARRVGPDGQLLTIDPIEVSFRQHQPPAPPVATFDADGGFSVFWGSGGTFSGFQAIYAQKLDADGARVETTDIRLTRGSGVGLDVTTDRQGNHLLFWLVPAGSGLFSATAQLYSPSWRALGNELQVGLLEPLSDNFRGPAAPAVVAGPAGFIAVWDSSGQIIARRFTTECREGSRVLCLQDRFRVEVSWRDTRNNTEGIGRALPLTSDSGALWFFHPANTELIVKVLDGRTRNGHFWVFYGALSDVEYDITVTDTLSGLEKVYHNPTGTMASRADTRAFPGDPPVSPTVPSFQAEESALFEPLHPPTGCLAEVCLRGMFNVEVEWRDPVTGELKKAEGAALTSDTAIFWFFGEENIELVVKVLDGRAFNGHYWVFFGALTNLEYTITVGWGDAHQARTYHNPRGQMASRADTRAFEITLGVGGE